MESVFRAVMTAAFERRDADAAAAHFAEDAVVVDHSDGGTVHTGRDAVAALIQGFLELLPDAECEVSDLIATGERLAAATVVRGTLPGHAEPTELHLCVFDVFQDGRIVSERIYGATPVT